MTDYPIVAPKKLIEVALPLDAINKACAREKSIRHGHPSTLHLWWARRPLAAARAVLFAQLVNDPSWKYTEEELRKSQVKGAITKKRNELFKLITELVQWENTTNEDVLERARREIRASWKETCEANKNHPDAKTLFDPDRLPVFHDPFAGGGAIPLEAQRLGLEAHASDLNPVSVLINKAMIEIPPKFAGRPPVGPMPKGESQTKAKAVQDWSGAKGLAEDVRRYAAWIAEETERRVGHLYPRIEVTRKMAKNRPDLQRHVGERLIVIAWLWARTARSPNPAFNGLHVPLVSTWFLSKKPRREAWAEPVIDRGRVEFRIRTAAAGAKPSPTIDEGTKSSRGSNFRCVASASPITADYLRAEGQANALGVTLLGVACEGGGERVFLGAEDVDLPEVEPPKRERVVQMPQNPRWFSPPDYGMKYFDDLFTDRQYATLTTLSDLVGQVHKRAARDAESQLGEDGIALEQGGRRATAYADAVALYCSFVLSKILDTNTCLSQWSPLPTKLHIGNLFGRQAIPMFWNFGEANPLGASSGGWRKAAAALPLALASLPARGSGSAWQADAAESSSLRHAVVSTDPPYHDNVDYADLSDFFYLWLRRSAGRFFPGLFTTMATPKADEIIVAAHRHSDDAAAESFFKTRMTCVMQEFRRNPNPTVPLTIYYAFKQSETKATQGTASTGWETFLEALLRSGFSISGTWPARTERTTGLKEDVNALASSIVHVCRARPESAPSVSRRNFLRELHDTLPDALFQMTSAASVESSVAPVDFQQAAIGPGMAIFSKYSAVLEADGQPMTIHDALVHINKAIDAFFEHAETDLDADTRFSVGWFQQYGFDAGPFGGADVLARAKGTAVAGVAEAGVLSATRGKVRLLRIREYPKKWDPRTDSRVPVWEACHHMCRALAESEKYAGELLARMPEKQDAIRQLAYRLYTICERQKWAEEARAYNELITSWPAIVEQSVKAGYRGEQLDLL